MEKPLSRLDRIAVFCINALSLLLPLCLLIFLLLVARPKTEEVHELLYTVTLPAVRAEYTDGMATGGERVLDAVTKRPIGQLQSLTVTQALTEHYSQQTQEMRLLALPGHRTVRLTVRARGHAVAGGYSIGGYTLYRGAPLSLRLPRFVGTGTCTDLQVLS